MPTRDDPKCNHMESVNRVTSIRDDETLQLGAAHRSVWVCARRSCVLDGMAWVERGPGIEQAYVYAGVMGSPEWNPLVSPSHDSTTTGEQ